MRQVLMLIHGLGMLAVAVALGGLALLAYSTATPANGQLLIAGVLALLAFLALLSLPKLKWQDEEATTLRGIVDDAATRFPVTLRFGKGGLSGSTGTDSGVLNWTGDAGAPVTVRFSEPEVHRVDASLVEQAKGMAAQGASVDEICRLVDPDHDSHDPVHQEAFRRIVRALVEEG